jgi:hypothetical protein
MAVLVPRMVSVAVGVVVAAESERIEVAANMADGAADAPVDVVSLDDVAVVVVVVDDDDDDA